MARKDSKNYNYTTQEQIMIKKNDDARLPKRLGSDEKIQAASEGSKIEWFYLTIKNRNVMIILNL